MLRGETCSNARCCDPELGRHKLLSDCVALLGKVANGLRRGGEAIVNFQEADVSCKLLFLRKTLTIVGTVVSDKQGVNFWGCTNIHKVLSL